MHYPTTVVYPILFVASIIYAIGLQWAKNNWPEIFDHFTWITVVIGVGYTLIGIYALGNCLSFDNVFFAFFWSGIPIVGRSIINALISARQINQKINGD